MFRFNYNSNDHMMILHVDKNFSKLYLVYVLRENTKGTVYTAIKIFSRVLFTFPWSINHKSFFLFPEIITRSRRFDMQVR